MTLFRRLSERRRLPEPPFHSVYLGSVVFVMLFCLLPSVRADTDANAQMLLGNPDNAVASPANRAHFLIQRPQYALSFNDQLHFPNWVAWHLNAADVGSQPRGQFQPDSSLPAGFTVVTPNDYTRSGYDRGHNCPSADRSANANDNNAVFLMSNMTPQAHGLNAGPWEQLESYCRDLTKSGNELYIVCGHGFSSATHPTIGRAKIAVPDFGWKIVVILRDQPGNDLARISAQTRVIAVRMPNINTIAKQTWTRYITTPAEIEQATGLRFFTALPSGVAAALRSKRDGGGTTTLSRQFRQPEKTGRKVFGSPPGGGGAGMVWVNLRSGAYWRPGTQYYGKTKEGKYMTEKAARKAGYHPAGGH